MEIDAQQTPVPRAARPAEVLAEPAAKRRRLEKRDTGEEFVRLDETIEVKYRMTMTSFGAVSISSSSKWKRRMKVRSCGFRKFQAKNHN